jgi:hypothetical protein
MQHIENGRAGAPGVEDVLDHQDMLSVELERIRSAESDLAGRPGARAVGRGADEIGGGRGGELPRQIGGEYKGALQHDDEAEGPAAVIGIDPAGERGDPRADAPLGNQQQEALGIVGHGLVRDCPVTLSRGAGGAWARNIASASLAVRDNGGVAARSAEPPLRAQGAFLWFIHPTGTGICCVPRSRRWLASPDLRGV